MIYRVPLLVSLVFMIACGSSPPEHHNRPSNQPGSRLSLSPNIDFDGDYQLEVINVRSFFTVKTATIDKRQPGPARLAGDDGRLYLGGFASHLLMVDENGNQIQGGASNVALPLLLGLAERKGELAALTANGLIFFRDGLVSKRFALPGSEHFADRVGFSPRCFDFDARRVLVPWTPRSVAGDVAAVYDRTGKLLRLVSDTGFDKKLLELSPFAGAGLWSFSEGIWYLAYMFCPRVVLFDPDFEPVTDFLLDSPAILEYEFYFFAEERTGIPNPRRNQPLFSDFAVFGGTGYLLGNGMLHRLDLHSGEVTGRYRFRAPQHRRLGAAFQLKFTTFSIRPDGSLVLGGGPAGSELFITEANVFGDQ